MEPQIVTSTSKDREPKHEGGGVTPIPESIRQRAADIVIENCGRIGFDDLVNAMMAERKRCADITRHLNGWGPVGGNEVADHIAKVIMESV